MKLEDHFEMAAPADTVWDVLNDVELIAPHLPGFRLNEVAGDTYRGTMKIKLGAMTVEYDAEIAVMERDAAARAIVLAVTGREKRGAGSVKATVSSHLEPRSGATHVRLTTDLNITGRVAQMGRGMLADVSSKLLADFVGSLEANVLSDRVDGQAATDTQPAPAPAATEDRGDVVDLTAVAGRSALRRLGPLAAALLLAALLISRRRRR